ncbi:hypothetical protein AKJ09_00070 [Labilithrix luteola]|uniref:RNA polymerase sigma-70 region 2 domain-containing protein n=1 Tax=Labilithrix luteola TaxID=1391654 RepID=A0A0K1PIG7_9BACT|nr:sigma-70 family RNA polymerase sigma factor [Labilithrix luteola]AKU93338.1 hypothetical protein AKJ09_00002 [Labilithrix luteola]AKU93406.1 hypothetical protein AKJ09_00070 [Labilithrix luteola]
MNSIANGARRAEQVSFVHPTHTAGSDFPNSNDVVLKMYLPLVEQIARGMRRPSSYDDFVQEGLIRLAKAADKWRAMPTEKRSDTFRAYAYKFVRFAMKRVVMKECARTSHIDTVAEFDSIEGAYRGGQEAWAELHLRLKQITKALGTLAANVYVAHELQGLDYRRIASANGIGHSKAQTMQKQVEEFIQRAS